MSVAKRLHTLIYEFSLLFKRAVYAFSLHNTSTIEQVSELLHIRVYVDKTDFSFARAYENYNQRYKQHTLLKALGSVLIVNATDDFLLYVKILLLLRNPTT